MINDVIKSGFWHVIETVYFAYFESFMVYRNTRTICKAYKCVQEL